MLAIAFSFPAGRYHATPWGRHVNEADIAWPPDVWRISRALIAVWHRKLDGGLFPVERLHSLLARLAEAPAPSFRLPTVAIHAHARHYMPGKGDKKTLVFDAFARVAADAPLVIAWTDLTLDTTLLQLLDVLLDNLGYLGRAESWVDARRVNWRGSFDCLPVGRSDDTGGRDVEIVRLLAPLSPGAYAEFRASTLANARIKLDPQGQPPAKLSSEQKKLVKTLPADWLAGVGVDTAHLQSAGWSAPPCARTVGYGRPRDSLQTTGPRVVSHGRLALPGRPLPTTARFVIYGTPLPRLQHAVRVGEAIRRAAMGLARRMLGAHALPPELSGHDLDTLHRGGHAFWLPEDADGDGAIDHVLIHAQQGFSGDAVRVLSALQMLRIDGDEPLRLMLEGLGSEAQFGRSSRCAGTATVWRSATPYLHPWHLKKPAMRSPGARLDAVAAQLRREWEFRGTDVPPIESVAEVPGPFVGGRRLEPVHFQRTRCKRGLVQPDRLGRMIELRFAQPVQGPLALGFGCHFGLGLFVASDAAAGGAIAASRPLSLSTLG